jgi:hypothetical protein
MARRSAVECASHGLVCRQLEIVDGSLLEWGLSLLHRIVAMLTSMVKNRAG